LVHVGDAEKMIAFCERLKLVILGIEGFKEDGFRLIPDMELIADFSALSDLPPNERCSRSVASAELFLKKIPNSPNLLLDFELEEVQG
jgi:hypothetical protein